MPQPGATTRVVLAMIAAICVTLIANTLDTSPTVSLIGATLAAAVPVLITAGGPHGIVLGVGVTTVALGVTYGGFTAVDAATDRPSTFPGSNNVGNWVEKQIPAKVDVPAVVDKPYAEAEETLDDVGLEVDRNDVESDRPPDTVVDQDPGAGTSVDKGTTVTLSVSTSPEGDVQVPDVRGQPLDDAQNQIDDVGLTFTTTEKEVTDESEVDRVIAQDPEPGTVAARGALVTLAVGVLASSTTTTTTTTTTSP